MKDFYINGRLTHKARDHNTKPCKIEKWVYLPHSDFIKLKEKPYQEHEAITSAKDLMYEDKNVYHCIMLLDEYILICSQVSAASGRDSKERAALSASPTVSLINMQKCHTRLRTRRETWHEIRRRDPGHRGRRLFEGGYQE